MDKKEFNFHLTLKIFSFDVIRMEENENDFDFWISCGRFSHALMEFFYLRNNSNEEHMTISEICIFIHKRCMKDGGKYSKMKRIVGNHVGVDPDFIEQYMDSLDSYYTYLASFKTRTLLSTRIYYSIQCIHPFPDGNGRVGKAIFAILNNNFKSCIKTYQQHTNLCKELNRLQERLQVYIFDKNCLLFNNLHDMLTN